MLPLHPLVYSEKPQATQEGFRNWVVNAQSESLPCLSMSMLWHVLLERVIYGMFLHFPRSGSCSVW